MYQRIVVVTKPTRLEAMRRALACSDDQLVYRLKTRGESADEYLAEDAAYHASLRVVYAQLPTAVPTVTVSREDVHTFLFRETDAIVAVGPDGLFVNVAKYLAGQPVVTVNPDPSRVDGVNMRAAPTQVGRLLASLSQGTAKFERVTLAKMELNDRKEAFYAVNEFEIGRADQVSARYRMRVGGREERQSSSGVLVSTGTGSTGWLLSAVTGAMAVTGGSPRFPVPFPREAKELVYLVREPFASRATGATIVFGKIEARGALEIVSEMPEGGCISVDGVVEDLIEFPAGTVARFTVADLVVSVVLP